MSFISFYHYILKLETTDLNNKLSLPTYDPYTTVSLGKSGCISMHMWKTHFFPSNSLH